MSPGASIHLALGNTDANVNGEADRLATAAMLRNGSTMVPLRWIGDALGAEVQWDPTERRVSSAPTLINGSTFVPLRFIGEKHMGNTSIYGYR